MAAVFAVGIALRLAFVVLYRPGFLGDADAGSYIDAAHHGLFSNVYDPAGYPLFIRVLHALYPHLSLLIIVQHGLAVASALLLYRAVRRLTGSAALGVVPAVVVLFDGYAIWVSHTPISETLFTFLVVAALCVTLVAPHGARRLLVADGVLLAAAGVVRPAGLVLIPLVVAWLLWTYPGSWRSRVIAGATTLACAALLVSAYVLVQRADTGFLGITRDSGRILYARAATFADCTRFTPPPGTRALCERTPPARRGSFNQYLTGYPDHARQATPTDRTISPAWRVFGPPPAGNSQLAAFGRAAILAQPLDYLRAVADDFHYYWADHHGAFLDAASRVDPGVERAVVSYYATGHGAQGPGLSFLRWYGGTIQVTGPLMIVLFLMPLTALLADGEARRGAILFACAGWLLPAVSDAVASVDPRFVLPAYGPLAAAGAIGLGSGRVRRGVARWRRSWGGRSGAAHAAPSARSADHGA